MFKKYINLCRENNKYLYVFIIMLFFLGVLDIIIPITASKVVDYLTIKDLDNTIICVLSLFIFYMLTILFSFGAKKTYTVFFKNNFIYLHKKIINKIYSLSENTISKVSKGKIISTVNIDIINISEIADYVFDIVLNMGLIITMIIIFIKTHVFLGIMVLIIDIIYLYNANKYTKKSAHYLKGQREYVDKLIGLLGETLHGLKEIRTSNIESNLNKKFEYLRKKWANKYLLKRKYVIKYSVNLKCLTKIFKIFLYVILIYMFYKNDITIGTILLLISYYDKVFSNSTDLIEDVSSVRNYAISLDRISNLIEYNEVEEILYGNKNNNYIDGIVSFKNVYFSYKDTPTIKNISFDAYPNKMTVIAGKTGSGKTTIFNLLLKLYKPNSGEILIDDENINNYTKESYKNNVAVLNQDSFMFNMSIKDNFSLVNNNENKQLEVCKRVGIHDFIMSLPNGYNTILKENASNVSGGQKRLLSLCKTLLSGCEVLLFDEVTSSLDPNTTKQIIGVLKDLKKDHTVIVITHKKELMKSSDNLIILNKGNIVAKGRPDKLVNNKYFNDLVK